MGSSKQADEILVDAEILDLTEQKENIDKLESHLVLVFTGDIRLAKYLLQVRKEMLSKILKSCTVFVRNLF